MSLSFFRKRHPPVGSRPGTLVVAEDALPPRIHVILYSRDTVRELDVTDVEQLPPLLGPDHVTWVDVQGLGDEPLLRRMAEQFHIHPLALEDVVNTPQRPKAEEYDHHLLLITRMVRLISAYDIDREQVTIFLGENYVLTFQEHYGDVLDPVRGRCRDSRAPVRAHVADFLGYAVLDTIIDAYYPVMEALSDRLERLEDRVLTRNPTRTTLDRLNRVKNDLVVLRRGLWPQLEALNRLLRDPNRFISEEVRVYLRDTTDHAAQLVDVLDSNRELINGLLNTYLSIVGNRTNEVMKVLTIMASIFIPLTFVAGVYGMNFEYMPELHSRWGYPAALGFMVLSSLSLLFYFRHRGWLGDRHHDDDDEDEARPP
ncbi:MAG TPA: magnesium/cobalt transporter CorA [Kofleriaceae bacterium]|nr:magnesium/cobalt transporter CorA [Kofleriaceae bacterium]